MDCDIRWLYRLHGKELEEVQEMLDQEQILEGSDAVMHRADLLKGDIFVVERLFWIFDFIN